MGNCQGPPRPQERQPPPCSLPSTLHSAATAACEHLRSSHLTPQGLRDVLGIKCKLLASAHRVPQDLAACSPRPLPLHHSPSETRDTPNRCQPLSLQYPPHGSGFSNASFSSRPSLMPLLRLPHPGQRVRSRPALSRRPFQVCSLHSVCDRFLSHVLYRCLYTNVRAHTAQKFTFHRTDARLSSQHREQNPKGRKCSNESGVRKPTATQRIIKGVISVNVCASAG